MLVLLSAFVNYAAYWLQCASLSYPIFGIDRIHGGIINNYHE